MRKAVERCFFALWNKTYLVCLEVYQWKDVECYYKEKMLERFLEKHLKKFMKEDKQGKGRMQ